MTAKQNTNAMGVTASHTPLQEVKLPASFVWKKFVKLKSDKKGCLFYEIFTGQGICVLPSFSYLLGKGALFLGPTRDDCVIRHRGSSTQHCSM